MRGKYLLLIVSLILAAGLLVQPASAKRYTYTQSFDAAFGTDFELWDNAYRMSTGGVGNTGCLRLTQNAGGLRGYARIYNMIEGWDQVDYVKVQYEQYVGDGTGGDGMSFNYGPSLPLNMGANPEEANVNGQGLRVAFDAYDNGTGDEEDCRTYYNGNIWDDDDMNINTADWRTVVVEWWRYISASDQKHLRIQYQGTRYDNPNTNMLPNNTWRMVWGGETGGSYEWHKMDDLTVVMDVTDLTKPTVPGTPSPNVTYTNAGVTFSWGASTDTGGSGMRRYYYEVNNGTANVAEGYTANTFLNFNPPAQGVWYRLRVRSEDWEGLQSNYSVWSASCYYDTVAPTLYGPANPTSVYSTNGQITFSWPAAYDAGGISQYFLHIWRMDIPWGQPGSDVGPGLVGNTTSYTFNGGQNGVTYVAWVYAIDNANNWGAYNWGAGCLVDTVAPSNGTATCAATANAGPITVNYSGASDNESGLQGVYLWYKVEGGAWNYAGLWNAGGSGSFSFYPPAGDTRYYFDIDSLDNAGNSTPDPTGSGDCSCLYDATAPAPGTAASPASATAAPITVTYSGAWDNLSGLKLVHLWVTKEGGYWVDSGLTSAGASGSFDYTPVAGDGRYYFDLVAEDNNGNFSAAAAGTGDCGTLYDANAPSVPTGLAGGGISDTALDIWWNASTDTVGVAGYKVFRNGSYIGSATSTTFSDTGLTPSTSYNYSVSAYDTLGNESARCAEVAVSTLDTPIAEAKKHINGVTVILANKVVVAVVSDGFYMEEADRSAGIKVVSGAVVNVGDVVCVEGVMATSAKFEKYVSATGVSVTGTGSVAAVGQSNKALGGTDFYYDPNTGAGQRGVEDGFGLNNIGMLVTTNGTVTAVASNYFYIDDGTQARDLSIFKGIRVICGGLSKPSVGQFVTVTGISTIYEIRGHIFRSVTTRSGSDIQVVP